MSILERLKPDPIPAIHPMPEYLASGQRAEWYEDTKQVLQVPSTQDVYEDIKTILQLPFVNTDYRAFARWPNYFALAWKDLREKAGTKAHEHICQDCHDLDEMRQAYGGRITDYVPVLPNRYHVGVEWRTEGFVSFAETSEAEQRAVVIAARYANDLMQAGRLSTDCAKLTHSDPSIVTASTAYGVVVAAVISGIPLDDQIGWPCVN